MVTPLPELGRFAEPALLILVSLSDGPKHGYAIMADVEQGTGRPMGPGTLYAALARLEERGYQPRRTGYLTRFAHSPSSSIRLGSARSGLDDPSGARLDGVCQRAARWSRRRSSGVCHCSARAGCSATSRKRSDDMCRSSIAW